MASKISWTDETWNVVVGCTKCSPGCQNCYAERMMYRQICMGAARHQKTPDSDEAAWIAYSDVMDEDTHGWNGDVSLRYSQLDKPLHWKKPRRIFVCSMGDLFHPKVPFEFIGKVMQTISCYPQQHIFQVLTKRPKIMADYFKQLYAGLTHFHGNKDFQWPFKNLHLGASISNLDELWKGEELARIPTAVRFVSFEPLLADMGDITPYLIAWHIHWVIIGCESINGRAGRFRLKGQDGFFKLKHKVFERAFYQATNLIIRQCKDARVPVFVKQIPLNGKVSKNMAEWPEELRVQEKPDGKEVAK